MSFDLDLVLDEYSLPVGKDRRGTFAGQYSPSRMGLTVIPSFDSTEVFWQDNYWDNKKRSKYDRSHYVIKLTLPDLNTTHVDSCFVSLKVMVHETIRNDFLYWAQHSVATLLRHYF